MELSKKIISSESTIWFEINVNEFSSEIPIERATKSMTKENNAMVAQAGVKMS